MCRVDGCIGPRGSTGLCPEHYAADLAARALIKFGPKKRKGWGSAAKPDKHTTSARAVAKRNAKPCASEGCEREARSRGLCAKHWQQDRIANNPPCEIQDCEKHQLAKGLCGTHYRQKADGRLIHP